MQFIDTIIAPVLKVSNVNVFGAVLLYGILQRKQGKVPMRENEQFMKPLRSIVGDTLYTKQTPTHQDEGANLEKEGVAREYPRTKDEYEATFQL
ncbi:hypothetical protein PVK06_034031 [Gossypium arboreum]|uniref:Uncharacterized protein n=1 Tax=Gossypium arboreum TaxID=29729 RepID=A0ABR0NDZ4_GOSAR|nr:hypothetical protein PVK06_034031 [Gossypium arboreum]